MKDYIKKHNKLVFGAIIGMLLLITGVIVICLQHSAVKTVKKQVNPFTITLVTNGGTEIDPIHSESEMEVLGIPTPIRSGYSFAGWFYDEAMTECCAASDILSSDTTLYAQWGGNVTKNDTTEFVDECSPDFSFTVYCKETLNADNLGQYLNFENTSFNDIALNVEACSGDTYKISASEGYPEGFVYKMTALSGSSIRFMEVNGQDVSMEETASYSFYVKKDNVYNVQFCDGIIMVPSALLTEDNFTEVPGTENADGICDVKFIIKKEGLSLKKGDIIAIGNGNEITTKDYFYIVSEISERKQKGVPVYQITGTTPAYSDIYKEYEIYFNQPVSMDSVDLDIEEMQNDMISSLQNSNMNDQIYYMTACAFKEDEQVLAAVETLTEEDQYRFYNMSITDIIDNIEGQAPLIEYVREPYTDSHGNTFEQTKLSVNITTSKLTFNLGTQLSNGKQVKIEFSATIKFSEVIKVVAYQVIKGDDSYDYSGAYTTTSVVVALEAVIMLGEDEPLDITSSIESCLSDVYETQKAYMEDFEDGNLFQSDLEYVTLAEQELAALKFDVYGLTFEIPISVKIEIGIQGGIYTSFSYTETEFVYITTGYMENGQIHNYDEPQRGRVTQYSKIHYNFTIKGKMGVRAGVCVGINVSILRMNRLFNIGIDFTIGCYCEWTGYASIDYDSGKNSTDLTGAIYWEIGIYGDLNFTWKLLGYEGSCSITDFTIPLLRMHSLYLQLLLLFIFHRLSSQI